MCFGASAFSPYLLLLLWVAIGLYHMTSIEQTHSDGLECDFYFLPTHFTSIVFFTYGEWGGYEWLGSQSFTSLSRKHCCLAHFAARYVRFF
jgi:hypothetical protein